MTNLDNYLTKHYLNEAEVATLSGTRNDELDALILNGLVPAPSYVVTDTETVRSFVFGEMAAPGSTPGRYFHPSQLAWITRAHHAIANCTTQTAEACLKEEFAAKFSAALEVLNLTTWRLRDSFGDDGAPIVHGLRSRIESAWKYFLNGTFGLCVANPSSEAQIAYKEVLQEKLVHQSENGKKVLFPPQQILAMHHLVDAYDAATMPFSPIEYNLSSRKRLIEDLRANICASDP